MHGSLIFIHPKYHFAIAKGHYSDEAVCVNCGCIDINPSIVLMNRDVPKIVKVFCPNCLKEYEITFGDYENDLDTVTIYNYE